MMPSCSIDSKFSEQVRSIFHLLTSSLLSGAQGGAFWGFRAALILSDQRKNGVYSRVRIVANNKGENSFVVAFEKFVTHALAGNHRWRRSSP